MTRFTWRIVSSKQVELTARDGCDVIRRRYDKCVFWLRGEELEAFKRWLERQLERQLNYLH